MKKLYKLLYPLRVVLIGSGNKEKPNVMSAAWCFPLSMDPPLFGISIAGSRYSYELIKENKEFTINIPGEGLENAITICGSETGREKPCNHKAEPETGFSEQDQGQDDVDHCP